MAIILAWETARHGTEPRTQHRERCRVAEIAYLWSPRTVRDSSTIGMTDAVVRVEAVDDRIETANHFHRIGLIIGEGLKAFYCRRLAVWDRKRGYLRDTRLAAPGAFKVWLDYCRDLCQNK